MENYVRYAVYAAPQPGPLAEWAAHWLGWDPEAGDPRAHPVVAGLPQPVAELTATPRKYGFHATLKPPFRLAETSSRAALEADLQDLARELPAVALDGLAVRRLGQFLALTPEADTSALARLAAEVVVRLDHHRAAPGDRELARRRATGLTPAQNANLATWGYPYVMDEFRFHFTLTGKCAPAEIAHIEAALGPIIEPLVPRPFLVDALVLFGEDQRGMFHILNRYPLTG